MGGMEGRDVYVRITNADGKSHIREHRVWDAEKFVSTLSKQGSSAKKEADRFTVTMVTREDYQKERGR